MLIEDRIVSGRRLIREISSDPKVHKSVSVLNRIEIDLMLAALR